MPKIVIGVIGAGDHATDEDRRLAREFGRLVAERGWVVLTGGRDAGVMHAACEGAKLVPGSLTVGVLPFADSSVSAMVDVAVFSDLGNGRNNVIVLSSRVVVACGNGEAGTASEVALALKSGKPVVLLSNPGENERSRLFSEYFRNLGGSNVRISFSPEDAARVVGEILETKSPENK